jgi:hypothetical protein
MNAPSDQVPSSEIGSADVFKGYKEAYKALRSLQPPISDAIKTEYIRNISESKSARYIAFRLLAMRAVGEMRTRLTPFIEQLEEILSKDSSPLDLRQCESMGDVNKGVSARLSNVRTKSDLKEFANAGLHLPILYGLIRVWDQPARFQAGLDALATTLERVTKSKQRQKATPSNNLEIVARALVARVPEKPLVGKALPELLKIAQALFRQSEDTVRENLHLQSELDRALGEGESVRTELGKQREAAKNLAAELVAARADLKRLQADLKQENDHFETLKAHGEAERKAAVQDAVARFRSEVSRRVENIRLFADRDVPNRQGILNLVNEIEIMFSGMTEEKS